MNIGNAIKEKRKSLGISQGELCAKVNLSQTYLSQIECNRKNPTYKRLISISDALIPYLFFLASDIRVDYTYDEKLDIMTKIFKDITPHIKPK